MLDQNTDRMWFVIGAVIVGAAIIFIANGALPTLFASVSDSFDESANKGIDVINQIATTDGNLIRYGDVVYDRFLGVDEGDLRDDQAGHINHATTGYMSVSGGKEYAFITPVSTWNKRIVYYDIDKKFIESHHDASLIDKITVAPINARYAKVSTRYKSHDSSPVDQWWFGLLSDDPREDN